MFESPAAMEGEVETKKYKYFDLESKGSFVTARFRPNWHSLCQMGREWHMWCLSHPGVMHGGIGTKNSFDLRNKVPFVTERFLPNLHWLWHIGRQCHMWYFNHPTAMRGKIRTKNCFGLMRKVPFVTARFRPDLQRLWRMWGSATCVVWFPLVQCQER
jgi:hypothetical protein